MKTHRKTAKPRRTKPTRPTRKAKSGAPSLGRAARADKGEIRAAALERAERGGSWNEIATAREADGWVAHMNGNGPGARDSPAGWLARQMYNVRHPPHPSDVGLDGWDRNLICRVAPTHAIELRCTIDGCAAFRLGPLPAEWFADPASGDLLCPQHAAARDEAYAVDRANLEPDGDDPDQVWPTDSLSQDDLLEIEDAERPLEDDDAISQPLDTLGPEVAASLDIADQAAHDSMAPGQRSELDRMARGEPVKGRAIAIDGLDQGDPEPVAAELAEGDSDRVHAFTDETTLVEP